MSNYMFHFYFQFKIPSKEAEAIAKQELESLFGTETQFINLEDPAQSLRKELRQNSNWTEDFLKEMRSIEKVNLSLTLYN